MALKDRKPVSRAGRGESFGLTAASLRTLRSLKTPKRIQQFIDRLTYQYADTAWSPQRVLRERKGHCLEGALLSAAALRVNGHPPLLTEACRANLLGFAKDDGSLGNEDMLTVVRIQGI